ncbi:ATP synthase gamma chain [Dietzia sp. NCCP-2495]|uniref:F0F1 ATP synthase subunit gamma n=1 Tax=Dietzia sp. NCCP-2495 TaxID=2934675 RepID=UPI002232058E|nr:F0F1 ATP synthase subunit gamma [Dietzia sp. NCCP-2495]GLB62492.1 ATP synthase gamma chain [Dietzia sp. NCCP-2495]
MANLRELRDRIKSVNSTKKITKAQEMIATSQISKAQARVEEAKPFADQITQILTDLANASSVQHRMLNEPENPKRSAVLVVTSDRGMCGGYNHNVLKEASELIAFLEDEGREVDIYVLGNKGIGYYSFRDTAIAGAWHGHSQKPVYAEARPAFQLLSTAFAVGGEGSFDAAEFLGVDQSGDTTRKGVDEVHIVYTQFVSMLTQTPRARRLAPIETKVEVEELDLGEDMLDTSKTDFKPEVSFEPDADTLLDNLLPRYMSTRAFASLLESAASESAARRTAMKSATDNATELVEGLSREANQARQAQITQEISEIVGGAGALAASAGSD